MGRLPKDQCTVRIHDEGDGSLWAEVPELPGCFASGDNPDELLEALTEAVAVCLGHEVTGAEWSSDIVAERHLLLDG